MANGSALIGVGCIISLSLAYRVFSGPSIGKAWHSSPRFCCFIFSILGCDRARNDANIVFFIMEIKIDGRLLVSTLCERFKKEFGGTLRVYNGNKRCTGSEKVADLVSATGCYECRGSKTVAGLVKDVADKFGLKVKVASCDDWVLALDNMTLAKLPDIPKNATKKDMEALKSKYAK